MVRMKRNPKLRLVLALLFWPGLLGIAFLPAAFASNESDFNESVPSADKVAAISYVTWWSHDAAGYHPSILLKLENYSGKDQTGQLIKFQSRFTDLTNGIVTVARREVRQAFVPHQQMYVLLKGPQPFDLPIEDYNWPMIECKVMCRVGGVDDGGTQTLIVTKLESITMNDDDAMQKMSRMSDFSRSVASRPAENRTSPKTARAAKPEKPLVATAGKLPSAHAPVDGKRKSLPKSAFVFISSRLMPGLGDDFYSFERTFGLPAETNSGDQGWTWASYKHSQPGMTILAGSRGRSGKVDVIILELPDAELEKESDIVSATRSLAGSLKNQKVSPPAHSVRYLNTGRMHLLTCSAQGYTSAYFTAGSRTPDGNLGFLVLSRIPGNVVDLISEHGKHAGLVQPVAQVLGGP